jgi:hypothetical protein
MAHPPLQPLAPRRLRPALKADALGLPRTACPAVLGHCRTSLAEASIGWHAGRLPKMAQRSSGTAGSLSFLRPPSTPARVGEHDGRARS